MESVSSQEADFFGEACNSMLRIACVGWDEGGALTKLCGPGRVGSASGAAHCRRQDGLLLLPPGRVVWQQGIYTCQQAP